MSRTVTGFISFLLLGFETPIVAMMWAIFVSSVSPVMVLEANECVKSKQFRGYFTSKTVSTNLTDKSSLEQKSEVPEIIPRT